MIYLKWFFYDKLNPNQYMKLIHWNTSLHGGIFISKYYNSLEMGKKLQEQDYGKYIKNLLQMNVYGTSEQIYFATKSC